jgi:hypothetical protein
MLDSSTLTFKPYLDNRVKTQPSFVEGLSGPLLLATDKAGRKFIVKYTHFHNAANELVASWLAYKIGAPAPHVWLLKPSDKFRQPYGVAIEYIGGLQPVDKDHLSDQMKKDIYAQFALNSLVDTDDTLQLSTSGGRIYSFDFSESFYVSDTLMLRAFLFSEDAGIAWAQNKLSAFCGYQARFSLDFTTFAEQLGLDASEMNAGVLSAAKKVLDITEDEIRALSDELCEMYPSGYAVYYEECIHAMQAKMKRV